MKTKQPCETENQKVFLKVSEASKILGISNSLIYKLVHQGDIKSVKFGRCRRISVKSINDYVASCASSDQITLI
jgi:excisionase family DNA binding protein